MLIFIINVQAELKHRAQEGHFKWFYLQWTILIYQLAKIWAQTLTGAGQIAPPQILFQITASQGNKTGLLHRAENK